jgi:large subunit ribosomal protein L33
MTRRDRFAPDSRRIPIALSCSKCGTRNYKTSKSNQEGTEALRLKKFCKTCNEHTEHIEAK